MNNITSPAPSFMFTAGNIGGPVNVRGQVYGTNTQAAVGINQPTVDPSNDIANSSASMTGRTAHNLPIFWLVVMMAVSIIILAHIAHVSLR